MEPTRFGTLLAHHRGVRNQGDVAERLGISRATLSQIECGKILPTGKTLARLLHYYSTDKASASPAPTRAQLGELMEALIACGGAA